MSERIGRFPPENNSSVLVTNRSLLFAMASWRPPSCPFMIFAFEFLGNVNIGSRGAGDYDNHFGD
jgi:hypothetical protein